MSIVGLNMLEQTRAFRKKILIATSSYSDLESGDVSFLALHLAFHQPKDVNQGSMASSKDWQRCACVA